MFAYDLCPFDLDSDCLIAEADRILFICLLLGQPEACNLYTGNGTPPEPPPPVQYDDCNENGVADEIDIGMGTSEDCNFNGIPDECEIAEQTSLDENENGIPDECEEGGESMQFSGGSNAAQSTGSDDEAYWRELQQWVAFDRWLYSTDFTRMTPGEIDAAMEAKMEELGLSP